MKKIGKFALLLALVIPLVTAGCGAGFVSSNPPPPKTVLSVTVTCTPTTLQLVASGSQPTSQCTWTVNYSDGTTSSLSSLVTLTASPSTAGTISAAGLFAPSTSVSAQTQVTITATSTENTAKSGTATITVNPVPPAVTVSVAPTTASAQAGSATPVQFTATVTNAANTNVTWSVNGVAGGNATFGTITAGGAYTAPAAVPNPAAFPVTATSVADTTKSASATVTITPVPVAPTITLSASTATVPFGGNASFTFTKTGTPDPAVTCKVAGTGACSVSGTAVSYTVPNPTSVPVSFVDTLTVTAQNSAGSASASVAINLVASITSATVRGSVDPQAAFCARYNCPVTVDIMGTGFFAASGFLQDLIGAVNGTVNAAFTVTDSSHATMTGLIGKGDFRPKPWHIGYRGTGPCCGFDSNVVNFVFTGNLDTMDTDLSRNHAAQLTQSSGVGQVIDLSTGSKIGSFSDGLVTNLAIDGQTGYIALAATTSFDFIDPSTGNFLPIGGGNGQLPLAVVAQGGYMCGSQDQAGQIVSLQIVSLNSTLVPLIVGNRPWQTAMLTLNNQRVCTVFNVGDLVFTVAPIPIPSVNPAPLWTLTVAGLTPLSQIPGIVTVTNIMPNGGWPLVVSQSASKAAILSRFDRKVAIIDLLAKKQQMVSGSPTVDLTPNLGGAIILRMAVDNTHQKAVISLAQTAKETSTFISVDLNTGVVSPMNAKTSFYATDLRVSQDGQWLYCGDSAGQFLKVPNQ